MGARSRVGLELPYRPARKHRQAELISLESIPGLLKSLKIRAQDTCMYMVLYIAADPNLFMAKSVGILKQRVS
jgi:hypothetical protein